MRWITWGGKLRAIAESGHLVVHSMRAMTKAHAAATSGRDSADSSVDRASEFSARAWTLDCGSRANGLGCEEKPAVRTLWEGLMGYLVWRGATAA